MAAKPEQTDQAGRLAPLRALFPGDNGTTAVADEILSQGWTFDDHPAVGVEPPVPWDDVVTAGGDWGRELHAWAPIAPLLSAYFQTGRPQYLDCALAFATDWVQKQLESSDEVVRRAAPQRVHRLAFIVDAARRRPQADPETVEPLQTALVAQIRSLTPEDELPQSVTGLGEALARLSAVARFPELPELAEVRDRAFAFVESIADSLVAPDGGTLEHSPGSQQALVNRIAQLADVGALPETLAQRRGEIEDCLAWMISPRGTLAQIGDTEPPVRLPAGTVVPHLALVASGGGKAPDERWRAYPESGWFVARAPIPSRGRPIASCSYLLQTCGRHSNRHKHDDDFSFVWFEGKTQILTDGGRYGFYGRLSPDSPLYKQGFRYSDPKRLYAESARAHNVATIDDGLEERPQPRRFGSGLKQCGEGRGLYFSQCERRVGDVSHTRLLAFRPATWVAVIDVFHDRTDSEHEFGQRFLFGPELEPRGDAVISAPLKDKGNVFAIPFFNATLAGSWRAQEDPLEGWASPKTGELDAAGAVKFAKRGTREVLATVLWLGEGAPQPVADMSRTNASARRVRLAWIGDGRQHQIDVVRDEGLEVRYRAPEAG
jgi:hypothetical protein